MSIEKTEVEKGLYRFTVDNGTMSFSATNYGCILTNIWMNDKNGKKLDLLLGYDSVEEYKTDTESFGAIVGRIANRVKCACFTLDGKKYQLDKNDGNPEKNHCLHGGLFRWGNCVWNAETFEEKGKSGVIFNRKSVDGEQGFPGNLDVKIIYGLTDKNELELEYLATTDAPTVINLTNHAYFNLDGEGSILDQKLCLDCDAILEADDEILPTGKILPVEGTIFDFKKEKKVGDDVKKVGDIVGGYDHCFITKGEETDLVKFGCFTSEKSGISMEMSTNQRGVHVYSGNFLEGKKGKGKGTYHKWDGICFETERYPNAMNESSFPSCVLRPGERYRHHTVFTFNCKK